MGVVRIDDRLERDIGKLLKKEENKYKYPSKSAFLNIIIYEKLLAMDKIDDRDRKRKKQIKSS